MTTHLENLEKSGRLILVREWSLSRGNCGLPVVCYHSSRSHRINITRVLLSKVDVRDGLQIGPQYSLRSTRRPVCILSEIPVPGNARGKSGENLMRTGE